MTTLLVSVEWLAEHAGDPDVRVVDARWYLPTTGKHGPTIYAEGHLPGAAYLDIDGDLAAPPGDGPGRHPLPTVDAFAGSMSRIGVGADTHVVAYDDVGGAIASRVWWLLRYFGHDRVSVLDGGIGAWTDAGHDLSTETPEFRPSTFEPRPDPARVVDRAAVDAMRRAGEAVILDARAATRYAGEFEPIDARPGHVPGALSAPFAGNLKDGRFLGPDELRARYEALGAGGERPVVVYCGSGVTACHDLLAMQLAGLGDGLLYEGSWSDWASDPSLPAATGPGPDRD